MAAIGLEPSTSTLKAVDRTSNKQANKEDGGRSTIWAIFSVPTVLSEPLRSKRFAEKTGLIMRPLN
jgi:hypothetical protein